MHYAPDELLDVVNEDDAVLGQQTRSAVYAAGLQNFRVINAFIMNDNNQIWVPRRSAHKKLFPRCLDASVGGHVQAGESYLEAFERELKEELNIDAANIRYTHIGYLSPQANNVSAHMQVYIIEYNQIPAYNTQDFESSSWFSIKEIQKAIAQGERTKGDLPILIDLLARIYDTAP